MRTASSKLDWSGEDVSTNGVHRRNFVVLRGSRPIPGMLWTPADARGPRPLVLICHGAGNTKRDAYVVALARRLVRQHSFAAAAIDGPVHGDRRPDGGKDSALMFLEFAQLWATDPRMIDEMVTDWRITLDTLETVDEIGGGPVGWWGLSMGTILGVPVVAAEERIAVAVLGLMGTKGPSAQFGERIITDARRIGCPVLFLLQWDDELVGREDALDLFGEIGAADKRLHAHPGGHAEVPPEGFHASAQFLADHLAR